MMTIETIRVRNPKGSGWLIVEFQGFVEFKGESRIGARIKLGDTAPYLVHAENIHPDDYKLLVEHFEKSKNQDTT
jgi:hypothetical protein